MKHIIAELAELNRKLDTIIGVLQKPENKFLKVMGIVGVLAVIDIIKSWILGG